MSSSSLQNRAEDLVYEAIDDISEELGIKISEYPDVIYASNRKELQSTLDRKFGLPDPEILPFEAGYLPQRNTIFLSSLTHENIGEESAHFIHYHFANIKPFERQPWDFISFLTIVESFGFFGSKLFCPRRTLSQYYSQVPEIRRDQRNRFAIANSIVLQSKTVFDQTEFASEWIHNEGYILGEGLYQNYISGFISAREIRNFFAKPLEGQDEALNAFLQLQYAVVHHNKKP